MSIASFIKENTQKKSNTETVTLRLPSSLLGSIDDLAATLDVNRQDVLYEFVSAGLKTALEFYEETENKPTEFFLEDGDSTGSSPSYFILNTNKTNNINDHAFMVTNGIAAAFSDLKYNIDKLSAGDKVFLYESGVGIVGFGKASGELESLGEKHQQKLDEYQKVVPLHARDIKKLVKHNMVFLNTMFKIPSKSGELIEESLQLEN